MAKSAKCTGDGEEHESGNLSNGNENCYNLNKNGKNEGPKMPILESRLQQGFETDVRRTLYYQQKGQKKASIKVGTPLSDDSNTLNTRGYWVLAYV